MIINHFKLALRKLLKQKTNLAINLAGLSIGLAASAIILLHVCYEYSYDKSLKNAENTYRIRYDRYQNGNLVFKKAMSTYAIGPLIKDEIPEVKNYARAGIERCLFFRDEAKFNDQPVLWADSTFLNVIAVKMLRGDANLALVKTHSLVISAAFAQKMFGNEDPMGKMVYFNEHIPLYVTGVFEDLPENSHLNFKLLISLVSGDEWSKESYGWGSKNRSWGGDVWLYTYITLEKCADPAVVEQKIAKVVEQHLPGEFKENKVMPKFALQRVTDIHLNSNLESEIKPNGNMRNIYFMLLLAIVILIIAWVNFINIAVAEASEKAKEIGVRKLIGAHQIDLIPQYMAEAFLLNVIGFVIAVFIINLVLPAYSAITNCPLVDFLQIHWLYYSFFFLFAIVGTFISGLYPAFVISTFNPLRILKGSIFAGKEKNLFKKVLVIGQLVATTILIISVLLIYKQINYIHSKELGFSKNNIVVIPAPRSLNQDTTKLTKFKTFSNRLLTNSRIEAVTSSYVIPGMEQVVDSRFTAFDDKPIDEIRVKNYSIDNNFLKGYKVNLLAGINFSENRQANRDKIIINEAFLQTLGLKDANSAIGHILSSGNNQKRTIVGVYSNFHQESLHSTIQPAVFIFDHPIDFGNYSIRINPDKMEETIEIIRKEWMKLYPYDPFDYFFEDQYIESLYKQDLRFGQMIVIFTILSVFIACLGLLGLIMIITAKNNKSIGVRKVNGATVLEIIFFLTRDFLNQVAIAFIFAVPLAYLLMKKWLENFAYRTEISWWIFIVAGLIVLSITTITVVWQTWCAATRNPVEALRYE